MEFFFSELWQKIMAVIMSFCMMLGINIPGFAPETDGTQPEVPESAVVISVATDESGKTTQEVALDNGTVIPAGIQLKDGVSELTLTITEEADSNISIPFEEDEKTLTLDVHMEGVSADNDVAIIVNLGEILDIGINLGNITIYHVENDEPVKMTQVSSMAELDAHNEFFYDVVTGNVTIAVTNFSVFALGTQTQNGWQGNFATGFAGGTGTKEDPYLIASADYLAYFSTAVNENNDFEGQYIKLIADINMSTRDDIARDENKKLKFYPIGCDKDHNIYAFKGTFDGAGHKISGIYQSTWELVGTYDNGYYNRAMGLFGWVDDATIKNLTIDHFISEGEFAPTGCVAAYAENSTFENIAVIKSTPQTYNTSVAAVVGRDCGDPGETLTFRNITVDSSNTVSALWGSWDVGAAGILGYLGKDTKVVMDNCHVAATIDVYNDVCGNYQYYWYRYCGMLIGTVHKTNPDGSLDLSNITATNCTVNFGDRHEYYYCEFEANTQASYTEDYQFSRVDHKDLIFQEDGTVTCTHNHTAKEDKQAVYLPFRQLFGGYGWGVDGVDLEEYNNFVIDKHGNGTVLAINTGSENSVDKFVKTNTTSLTKNTEYELGTLFTAIAGADINDATVSVGITTDKTNPVTMEYTPNTTDWTKSTVKFTGTGTITIIIQDYNFCNPATLEVTIR